MLLPITLTLAAACALLNIWLAMRVGRVRMAEKILHGDGGGTGLLVKRMRAQANFVEYTPFVLILFALIEMALGSHIGLSVLALVYVVARFAHAFGMDADYPHKARMIGILLTFAVLLILSGMALYAAYSATRAIPAPPALAARV
ncbi:MAG: MAPEG family protein [bacterium]|nr:MAPEG family protein [bacterium]